MNDFSMKHSISVMWNDLSLFGIFWNFDQSHCIDSNVFKMSLIKSAKRIC